MRHGANGVLFRRECFVKPSFELFNGDMGNVAVIEPCEWQFEFVSERFQ